MARHVLVVGGDGDGDKEIVEDRQAWMQVIIKIPPKT